MQAIAGPAQAAPAHSAASDIGDAALVRRHATALFRYLRALGASRDVADDLTQEAFVVVWQKQRRLPEAALASFLRRTARYLWLEHRRGERRAEAAIAAAAEKLWQRDCADGGEQLVAATKACVQRLRGRAAAAVAMTYAEGRGRDDIARALGMQPNGVRTLLARTRQWLGDCIRRQLP